MQRHERGYAQDAQGGEGGGGGGGGGRVARGLKR